MSKVSRNKHQVFVRIDEADRAILKQLAVQTGESTPELLHRAVTQLKKTIFFDEMNAAYRDMRENPAVWQAEEQERALFDNASSDRES